MEIQITRHGIGLSEKQAEYLKEKIEKVTRAGGHLDSEATIIKADVYLLKIRNEENVSVEITIVTTGAVIRAEEAALTFEAAVDLAEEKLRTQLRRYKDRYKKRRPKDKWITAAELAEDIPEDEPRITHRKRFSNSAPIHEEEAIELMELSGHDFFLFNNLSTARWSVVYKRQDGNYGIIEPKMGAE